MQQQDCIFCNIISEKIESDILDQTEHVIVIKDIAPKAPIHYLIIPRKHVSDLRGCSAGDSAMLADMLLMSKKLSAQLTGSQEFKLIANNGASVGQCVLHMHFHFLAGKQFV